MASSESPSSAENASLKAQRAKSLLSSYYGAAEDPSSNNNGARRRLSKREGRDGNGRRCRGECRHANSVAAAAAREKGSCCVNTKVPVKAFFVTQFSFQTQLGRLSSPNIPSWRHVGPMFAHVRSPCPKSVRPRHARRQLTGRPGLCNLWCRPWELIRATRDAMANPRPVGPDQSLRGPRPVALDQASGALDL